mgnify:CR=1 FL=1
MILSSKIIRKPVITEKSLRDAASGEYTFEVAKTANKIQIAKAVAELFKVDVKRVKTNILKNRSKRVLRTKQKAILPAIKKAMVKVGKEQKIDIFEVKK